EHAFATGDAGRFPHRVVEVKSDASGKPFAGPADDKVVLHIGAGARAAVAEDAGGMVNLDEERGVVLRMDLRWFEGKALGLEVELRGKGIDEAGEVALLRC